MALTFFENEVAVALSTHIGLLGKTLSASRNLAEGTVVIFVYYFTVIFTGAGVIDQFEAL